MGQERLEEIFDRKQRRIYQQWVDRFNDRFANYFEFEVPSFDELYPLHNLPEIDHNSDGNPLTVLSIDEIDFGDLRFFNTALDFYGQEKVKVTFPSTEVFNPSITVNLDTVQTNLNELLKFNDHRLIISDVEERTSVRFSIGRTAYDNDKGETLPFTYALLCTGLPLIEAMVEKIKTATNKS